MRGVMLVAALGVAAACANGADPSDDLGAAGSANAEDGGSSGRTGSSSGATTSSSSSGGGSSSGSSGTNPGVGDSGQGSCTPKVVINELQSNGPNGAEFIELYNSGNCAVDLSGWQLAYRSAAGNTGPALHKFDSGSSISAKTFLLLANAKFTSGGTVAPFNGAGSLGNTGGQVGLLDDGGKMIDGVGYGSGTTGAYTEGSPAPAPGTNGSIGRKTDGVDTDDNASDFKGFGTPSPGVAN